MIDYNDADDMGMLALLGPGGWFGAILCIIAIVFYCFAASNDADFQKKNCPNGQRPKLMEHSCLCVSEAK